MVRLNTDQPLSGEVVYLIVNLLVVLVAEQDYVGIFSALLKGQV